MSTEEAVRLFEYAEAILASVTKVSSRNQHHYGTGSDHYENNQDLCHWGLKEPYELASYVKRKLGDRVADELDKRKDKVNRKFLSAIRGLENAEV